MRHLSERAAERYSIIFDWTPCADAIFQNELSNFIALFLPPCTVAAVSAAAAAAADNAAAARYFSILAQAAEQGPQPFSTVCC